MKLIEVDLHFWELYQDHEGIYLKVNIFLKLIVFEKCVILDKDAIKNYLEQGKDFIDRLSKQIRSSHFRNDYNRFYPYPDTPKDKRNEIFDTFYLWVKSSNAPYDPYFFER